MHAHRALAVGDVEQQTAGAPVRIEIDVGDGLNRDGRQGVLVDDALILFQRAAGYGIGNLSSA